MDDKEPYEDHFRAIRTSIAALALAVLSAPLIINNDHLGFYLFILTLIIIFYSFIPTSDLY